MKVRRGKVLGSILKEEIPLTATRIQEKVLLDQWDFKGFQSKRGFLLNTSIGNAMNNRILKRVTLQQRDYSLFSVNAIR